jgi:hypothetical protein
MIESVLLEWFWQKQALNILIQDPVLRQKAEEIALKLNIQFMPSSEWHMQGLATESGVSE